MRPTSLLAARPGRRARVALGGLGLAVALTATVACASGPLVAGAAAAPSAGASDAASAPAAAKAGRTYVALGDSYTAGPLIPEATGEPFGCLRSTSNYPHLLAKRRNLALTDVSCSGADTTNFLAEQETFAGNNPAQLDALGPATRIVTVGMGGNDYSLFGSMLSKCAELYQKTPTGSPCKDFFTRSGTDVKKRDARAVGERMTAALAEIRTRAPEAQVVVVGYLRIVPADGTVCQKKVPFAKGDYRWANSVEQTLNAALASAARTSGVDFVGMYPTSLGHDACAGQDAWVNGVRTIDDRALQFHPFAAGMDAIAKRVGSVLR